MPKQRPIKQEEDDDLLLIQLMHQSWADASPNSIGSTERSQNKHDSSCGWVALPASLLFRLSSQLRPAAGGKSTAIVVAAFWSSHLCPLARPPQLTGLGGESSSQLPLPPAVVQGKGQSGHMPMAVTGRNGRGSPLAFSLSFFLLCGLARQTKRYATYGWQWG